MNLQDYRYLWDGSSKAWALLHVNAEKPDQTPSYLIVNTDTKRTLLIEDDILSAHVKQEMLACGVPVVSVGNGF